MTRADRIASLVSHVAAGMAANPECEMDNRELAKAVFDFCEDLVDEGFLRGFYFPPKSLELPRPDVTVSDAPKDGNA